MILSVSGKIGSGKDTVGKIIQALIINRDNPEYFKVPLDNTPDFPMASMINFINGDINIPGAIRHGSGWEIKKFAGKLKQIVSILTGCDVGDLERPEFKDSFMSKEWEYWVRLVRHDGGQFHQEYPKYLSEEEVNAPHQNAHSAGAASGIYTYRSFLQAVGTNAMRDMIHRNVWVNALFADYKWDGKTMTEGWVPTYNNPDNSGGQEPAEPIMPNWIITDTRFPNEAEAVKNRGGLLIRVNRTWRFEHGLKIIHNLTPLSDQHPSETALDDYKFDYVINNDGTLEELIEKVREILIAEKIL